MANGNKKSGKSYKPCDLYPPHTSTQTPQMCVRKTFSTFFVPQPAENNTYHCLQDYHVTCVRVGNFGIRFAVHVFYGVQ